MYLLALLITLILCKARVRPLDRGILGDNVCFLHLCMLAFY